MDDKTTHPALSRIDRAIQRIERATATSRVESARLQDRHAALRARIGEAIAALDGVIDSGNRDRDTQGRDA